MTDDVIRTHEPHDRLTKLADKMTEGLPDDIKAIVLVVDDDRSGVCLHGWESDSEAIAHMFLTLKAAMKANGINMNMITDDGAYL